MSVDLNNLSKEQKSESIAELRRLIGDDNAKYDDRMLLRFLVARQMNAPKALEMLNGYFDWRKTDGIDNLPIPGINGNPVMQNVRGYKCVKDANWEKDASGMPEEFKKFYSCMGGGCFHKVDKQGTPVFIERTGLHDVKGLAQKCPEKVMLDWHVRNNEFIFNVLMKECSERRGEEVEKHTVIFDCTGLGFHQFDMTGLYLLKAVADLDSKVYPERLGKLFIVNTPALFARAWNIIKKWLDKRILEKINICGSDFKDVLLEHIDAENLPEFLGGSCTCSHMPGGCVPSPYLEAKEAHTTEEFPHTATIGNYAHKHEIEVPREEGDDSGGSGAARDVKLSYRFRTSKKAVQFEIRHRKEEGSPETIVVPMSSHDSHKDVVSAQLLVEPGTYVLHWQKHGGAFTLLTSLALDYSVDLAIDDKDEVVEKVTIHGAQEPEESDAEFEDAATGTVRVPVSPSSENQ